MTNTSSFSETKTYLYNVNICGQMNYWLKILNGAVKFKKKTRLEDTDLIVSATAIELDL